MNRNAMNNHADSTIFLAVLAQQSDVLAGCSQDIADKMLDVLALAAAKLELLTAIAEEVENAFDAFDAI